ncbi:hypothetical protein SAMN05216327_109191 [Dyadobacter sp. SG02]|uniref:hypothetical protein n=1 Tax=Dyadobacter sp. SG02 TaxID=1855291 RepID=UPI0008C43BBD|nr:hypothetical protein [Dyadobacter sp. SG02]SEJ38922.1 hypothetical protein SAMN05216327_109191 [Dyadobacter sp. SG02]
MNETILLPVDYLGEVLEVPLTIVPLGYTYQLHMQVEGKTLIFEKDDQGEYRVINTARDTDGVSKDFVAAIVATLQAL